MKPLTHFLLVAETIVILAGRPAVAIDNPKCAVPHTPHRWRAVYCTLKEHKQVDEILSAPCMTDKLPRKFADVCKENAYWKEKWCGLVAKDMVPAKSVKACLADKQANSVAEGF